MLWDLKACNHDFHVTGRQDLSTFKIFQNLLIIMRYVVMLLPQYK